MVTLYTDDFINENERIRTFINDNENLQWHKDKEDRYVTLLEGKCSFIVENESIIEMEIGTKYFIPKETFHRILKIIDSTRIWIVEVK